MVGEFNPYASRLALQIVQEHFGDICCSAAKALVDHGTQTWVEISRAAGLPSPQLRQAMQVLLQHNYVNCYLHKDPPTLRGPGPSYHLYQLDIPRVIQSLRQPRFLTMVRDEQGEEAEGIVHRLMEHGRLRLERLVEQAQQDQGAASDTIVTMIASLINARYIERVPPCTLPPPAQPKVGAAKKKAAKKEVKAGSEEEAELLREQAEAQLRQAYMEERFKLPTDFFVGSTAAADGDEQAADGRGKRKRGKGGEDQLSKRSKCRKEDGKRGGTSAAEDEGLTSSDILWRVNFEEFNRRLRNDTIVEWISSKSSEEAGTVVAAMLKASSKVETSLADLDTPVLSEADIRGALRLVQGREAPANISAVLDELENDEVAYVEAQGNGPGGRQVIMHIWRALHFLRLLHLKATIRARFGVHGMRIWSLLLESTQLEQKQVADMAMLPKEEARELLYAMLRAGFVRLQDVPRTTDHAPSRTFYTWQVTLDAAVSRLAQDLHRAAGNLYARLAHEVKENSQLLELGRLMSRGMVGQMEPEQMLALQRVRRKAVLLESGLLELDNDLALMVDF